MITDELKNIDITINIAFNGKSISEFMSIIQCFPGAACVCTLPAEKEAEFAGLEQKSDARIPIVDVVEQFL